MFRYLFLTIISLITLLILWINIQLQTENHNISEKRTDVVRQLNFLESELRNNNLGDRMQQIFPEGYVFVNALYGLSWCELALSDSLYKKEIKNKALGEALYAYHELDSYAGKMPFDMYLNPEYGIFYCGWKNYLLSKILCIDTTFQDHEIYIALFTSACDSIKSALDNSESPFLESYFNQAWPADMFVAMASLSNYDKIFIPKYEVTIKGWLEKVKMRLDPITQMIPHKVDPNTGKCIQGARGCSMSLVLRMLAEIEKEYATSQFNLFKSSFVETTFGLPSVREYPKGQPGSGDIDSAPVIFGVGFSATIMSIGTLSLFNCYNLSDKQYKTVNAFGFEFSAGNKKRYLFGQLPVADAFISWGRASSLKYMKDPSKYPSDNWRLKFHLISFFIITLFWFLFFRKGIRNRIRKIKQIK
jgi:hypothetical protein